LDIIIPAKKVNIHTQDQAGDPVSEVGVQTSHPLNNGTSNFQDLTIGGGITNASGDSSYGSGQKTNAFGDLTIWLFPNDNFNNHNYILTVTPQNINVFSPFTYGLSTPNNQTELLSLQYNHATPVTSIDLTTQHGDGTYSNPTIVSLSAIASDGYTIANTYYTIDGGEKQTYAASFPVSGAGEHTITYWSVDNVGVYESPKSKTFTIVIPTPTPSPTETPTPTITSTPTPTVIPTSIPTPSPIQTRLTIISPATLAQGQVVSARLTTEETTPISGKTVTMNIGNQNCSGITNQSGNIQCTITNLPLGNNTLTANFAGDQSYQPATATQTILVYAYATTGAFVLGDQTVSNALPGITLTWWGSQWAKTNTLTNGSTPSSFKGFAESLNPTLLTCGGTWTTSPGNSSNPPAIVPSYMPVLVSSSITKSGSTISGDIQKILIVETDSGYAANPENPGTGIIVATLCSK
jgi:hypothetical protein